MRDELLILLQVKPLASRNMINGPIVISQPVFQSAWVEALSVLSTHNWELRNLVVQITDPTGFDGDLHRTVLGFCDQHSLLGPKHVAYTIFPHRLYRIKGSAEGVFEAYNGENGLYQWLRGRPRRGWGTYFRRMTHYETPGGVVNQLDRIIKAINAADCVRKAAYTIMIQKPGGETVRPLGSPCLNYIAIQLKRVNQQCVLGMLCIYRNHDFVERAYGNYLGLCNLACFLAQETNSIPGPVTCVSSHAYVDRLKTPIRGFLSALH